MSLLIVGADVRAIHNTGRDDTALLPFLAITEAFTDSQLIGKGLTNAVLKEVQRYLTAHWLYVSDVGVHAALRVDDTSETFTASKKEPGLRDSHFGRTAIMLDHSGTLREASDLKPRAEISLLINDECSSTDSSSATTENEFPIELPSINSMPPGPGTFYLGPGGWSSVESDAWFPMDESGSIVRLRGTMNQNPGAGGVIYTLRRAPIGEVGADQALAGSLSGVTRDFGVDGAVAYAAGDRCSVKVVLGAGVLSADHNLVLTKRRGGG